MLFPSLQSISHLIENTVPASIRLGRSLKMDDPVCKFCLSLSSVAERKHVSFVDVISSCICTQPTKQIGNSEFVSFCLRQCFKKSIRFQTGFAFRAVMNNAKHFHQIFSFIKKPNRNFWEFSNEPDSTKESIGGLNVGYTLFVCQWSVLWR